VLRQGQVLMRQRLGCLLPGRRRQRRRLPGWIRLVLRQLQARRLLVR
jgi:hypothetical protein